MKELMRARIREASGEIRHLTGSEHGPTEVQRPAAAAIAEDKSGYFLLRFDEQGLCVADTWHQSLLEAKRQAIVEYGIVEEDWVVTAKD